MPQYDLEIAMPVSLEGKYRARLEDFKKYGLLNIGDIKVHLSLLVGREGSRIFRIGWPSDITVSVVNSNRNHHAAKVAAYYKSVDVSRARWYGRVDDDSATDVARLIENLDTDYEWQEKFYITTQMLEGNVSIEKDIFKDMKLERESLYEQLMHDHECGIISQMGMATIRKDKDAVEFLERRAKIEAGYTDIPLGAAAKICKIYPTNGAFLSKEAKIGDFSFLGGHLSHIHMMSRDGRSRNAHKYLMDRFEPLTEQEKKWYDLLKNRKYVLSRGENEGITILCLNPSGRLDNTTHANEKLWQIKENNLEIINLWGDTTSVFKLGDNLDYIEGNFLPNKSITHILRTMAGPV
jgi:hypothetical protein